MNPEIIPFEQGDIERIRTFFESLDGVDRTFIHADALGDGVIETWVEEAGATRERRHLAIVDDDVVGYLAVLPESDWSAHVAVIRIVVHPSHRRQGIASALARHAIVTAARDGIKKLVVEVMSEQEATIAMFTGLGFEAEGILRGHLADASGHSYDLLVLSHFVDELYETMTTVGVDREING